MVFAVDSQVLNFSRKLIVKSRPEECADVVLTYTENRMIGWGVGVMADCDVVMRSNISVSRLDTSGYVTAGNSRLVCGCLWFVGNDAHLQGTNNMTIRVYIRSYIHHCICNIRELITYSF
jgi:hypothetical protein